MSKRLQWLAGPNLIGHATDPADRWRTLCGLRQVIERLAYPVQRPCRVCEARAAEREGAPIGK